MRKKIFFIAIAAVLLFLAVLFLFISNLKPPAQNPDSSPNTSPAPIDYPSSKILDINGVKTRDFLSRPITTNSEGDVLFVKKESYQIVYLNSYKQFLIDISTSSAGVREQAEQEFIDRLGISKDDACRLNVAVSSPYAPNPYLSVPPKYLTFCRPD